MVFRETLRPRDVTSRLKLRSRTASVASYTPRPKIRSLASRRCSMMGTLPHSCPCSMLRRRAHNLGLAVDVEDERGPADDGGDVRHERAPRGVVGVSELALCTRRQRGGLSDRLIGQHDEASLSLSPKRRTSGRTIRTTL